MAVSSPQQAANVDVPCVSAGSVFVQSVRADRAGVHAVTDQYDSEVSAYFRDGDGPQAPTAFRYLPSPPRATSPFASIRADSRQSRAASWVDNVHSAAMLWLLQTVLN